MPRRFAGLAVSLGPLLQYDVSMFRMRDAHGFIGFAIKAPTKLAVPLVVLVLAIGTPMTASSRNPS